MGAALVLQAAFYSRQLEKETPHVLLWHTAANHKWMLVLNYKLLSEADS